MYRLQNNQPPHHVQPFLLYLHFHHTPDRRHLSCGLPYCLRIRDISHQTPQYFHILYGMSVLPYGTCINSLRFHRFHQLCIFFVLCIFMQCIFIQFIFRQHHKRQINIFAIPIIKKNVLPSASLDSLILVKIYSNI